MEKRIIYKNNQGGVSVIIPAPEYADQIEAIAAKDVPTGAPYRILSADALPSRDTRDQWRWTDNGPLIVSE